MNQPDTAAEVTQLRRTLSHPVVDGDGHIIESFALFSEYLRKLNSTETAERVITQFRTQRTGSMGDPERGDQRGAWWGVTNDAKDLATVMAPALLSERLEEIGLDFTVLYPTLGLGLLTLPDPEARRLAVRALNTMLAELSADHQRHLTVAASIPMHTPEEAIAELEHCVGSLGMKVAAIPAGVARPWPAYPEAFPTASFVDRYGLDSHFDYDPVWETFQRLGVAVTCHGAIGLRYLDSGRRSPTNYMFNHIGGHAYQQCELAKSLIMGGVPLRFPDLRFAFLEGGVGWACDLLHSLAEHWEKRNAEGLEAYDPGKLDGEQLAQYLRDYGINIPEGQSPLGWLSPRSRNSAEGTQPDWARDEFEPSGITDEEQFAEIFSTQFYFGCEADDRGVYRALDGKGNPFSLRLNAMFSSDIGHWDVPHLGSVLLASRGLVQLGLLSEADYRDFVFTHPVRVHGEMNPRFFEGTPAESAARELLANGSATRTTQA
ncbi:MAG: amidohydrolase family protein [SAR324 cluster bacterium]|nr:amidohydrolase family protein [SAR324 cluster bacterium]